MENFETINEVKRLEHMGGCVGIICPRVIPKSLGERFYQWIS
jgi:hypothetical protein